MTNILVFLFLAAVVSAILFVFIFLWRGEKLVVLSIFGGALASGWAFILPHVENAHQQGSLPGDAVLYLFFNAFNLLVAFFFFLLAPAYFIYKFCSWIFASSERDNFGSRHYEDDPDDEEDPAEREAEERNDDEARERAEEQAEAERERAEQEQRDEEERQNLLGG